ncbi:MAG TPA: FliH/SctL family protein [Phycisphaerae bacterium]|nr:hypothetical protein [Phycisphaerae bacterium]HOB74207.1 FliH/SctL family protein [Phycisphaerae bacterium]HOJ54995.1 FliH/SctL family protein [Phycisphaerae bacterium]HOL26984.1 FliH/SctL family protein [Phycisphaerae bacterium]HPP21413.1 FliH/SctL family protein [Phycisphaerae bacterium]
MKKLGVIKAETMPKPEALGLRPFHFNDVASEARSMVEHARREAEAIRAEARKAAAEAEALVNHARVEAEAIREMGRRDAEALREAARQEGFQAGWEAGLEEGRARALAEAKDDFAQRQAHLVNAFRSVMDTVEKSRADWLAAARQDLVELAMAIARRVARHVGQRDRDVVLANLEEAVRLVGARSDVTIAVNPADAEAARLFAQSLLDLKEHWEHIQVVEEPEVSPGGCQVHWNSGSVDATLETQLDRIEEELRAE